MHLEVRIDKELSQEPEFDEDEGMDQYHDRMSQRRSWVFAVRIINAQGYPYRIPRLVLKLASERRGKRLAHEAGMYDELQGLQGKVIPKYYGYFRTRVDLRAMSIVPWDPKCEFPINPDDEFRPPHPAASLNLILVERLGGHIPYGSVRRKPLRYVV